MKRLVARAAIVVACSVAISIPTSLVTVATHAASKQYVPAQVVTSDQIVALAQRYLGSPYAIIGDSPSTGFSCIGFVHFIFAQLGVDVPYDIPMAWNSAPHVSFNDLQPGDVLFYSNTVFAGLSHVAIYIGNGKMIGADSFAVGVTVDTVGDTYWMAHYTGATRPLAATGAATTPAVDQSTPTFTPTPAPPVAASASAGSQLQPLSTTVGVYSGPGYQYTPLGILGPTTVLTVVQGQDGWYDVRFQDAHMGDTFGWVNAEDVAPVHGTVPDQAVAADPASSPTPAPTMAATPQPSPISPFSRAAAVTGAPTLVVVAGPLNVRSGPGKQYAPLGAVRKGDHLSLLDTLADWVQVVTSSGLRGWVARQYVAPLTTSSQQLERASATQQATVSPATAPAKGTARVIASVLNVRDAPNEHGHVISVLFAGEVVPVLARSKGWDEVQLRSGTVGWVSAQYVKAAL